MFFIIFIIYFSIKQNNKENIIEFNIFYYLRIIKTMFFNEGEDTLQENSMFYHNITYILSASFVTFFAFYPDPIIFIINNYFS